MQLLYKKGMIIPLLLISICITFQEVRAQVSTAIIDSLRQALQNAPADSNKIKLSFQLGRSLWFSRNIPEAIDMLHRSIRLSDEKKYYTYASDARLLLANAYSNLKQYDSSFSLLRSAMQIAVQLKQEEHIPKINNLYAYLFNVLGDTKKAIEYGLLAAEGFEKSNIPEVNIQSVYAWIEIGRIFAAEKQFTKALEYFNRALQKAKTSDKDWYMRPVLINIANVYVEQSQLVDAQPLYQQVVNMNEKEGGVEYKIWGLLGLGDISLLEKKYNDAISYFHKALYLSKASNMNTNVDHCLINIGHAFMLNNQYDSAEIYLQNSLQSAKQSRRWSAINDNYRYLAELYAKKNKYKEALAYERLYRETSDSIYNKEKLTIISNLEMLYQTNQKEKEIIRLQAANAEKELQLVKQNRWLLIIGLSLGFMLIIFVLFFRNSTKGRMIAKQQQQLQEQRINSLEQEQKVIALKSMLAGQEAERTRIAKDLHDSLGGLFSTVKMHLSTLQHENGQLKDNELFQKSYRLVDMASADLRGIAHNMMPEVLLKLGLVQALKDFCNSITSAGSFHISLLTYGMEERLPVNTEIMVYRIVQELLNNIIKHAKATEVIVQFNRNDNHIDITVEDNGCGFDPNALHTKPHAGLDIIRTRVNYLNGAMSMDSQPGIGTTVMITFDIDNKAGI